MNRYMRAVLEVAGFVPSERVVDAYRKGKASSARIYEGAQVDRLTQDFPTYQLPTDQDIRTYLVQARERARYLVKNTDLGKNFMVKVCANVVGPNGFKLQMKVTQPRANKIVPDKVANDAIELAWTDFCRAENCSVTGMKSFRQVCNQLIIHKKRDGEAFLRIVRNRKAKYGLLLQIIPPEAIDENRNIRLSNGNVVRMGIEIDQWHRPVNYYVKKINPNSELFGVTTYVSDWDIVPASEIIHHQSGEGTRGISELIQSAWRMKMIDGYEKATLVNARANAGSMGILSDINPDDPSTVTPDDRDDAGNPIFDFEPGTIHDIGKKKFEQWKSEFPSAQHEAFMKTSLKLLSAGLGTSYASLTNDLSEANYSSNRVGLMDERELWKMEQEEFIENVLNRLFGEWLESALLRDRIVLPSGQALPAEKFEKFNSPTWTGRRWSWVDPLKDAAAAALLRKIYLETLTQQLADKGDDLTDTLTEFANEREEAKSLGIDIALDNVKPTGNVGSAENATDEALPGKGAAAEGKSLDELLESALRIIEEQDKQESTERVAHANRS